MIKIGLDVGSTTLKCVALNEIGAIIYSQYERHYSKISEKTAEMLKLISERFTGEQFSITISGSAGMGIANQLDIQFAQEVYATRIAVKERIPEANVVIELGGEDDEVPYLAPGFGYLDRDHGLPQLSHFSVLPPMRCKWRWCTLWPASSPTLVMSR